MKIVRRLMGVCVYSNEIEFVRKEMQVSSVSNKSVIAFPWKCSHLFQLSIAALAWLEKKEQIFFFWRNEVITNCDGIADTTAPHSLNDESSFDTSNHISMELARNSYKRHTPWWLNLIAPP